MEEEGLGEGPEGGEGRKREGLGKGEGEKGMEKT